MVREKGWQTDTARETWVEREQKVKRKRYTKVNTRKIRTVVTLKV